MILEACSLMILSCRVATGVHSSKLRVGDLEKKGWDPRQDWAGDRLYWLNGRRYEKLDGQSWLEIENGRAKL